MKRSIIPLFRCIGPRPLAEKHPNHYIASTMLHGLMAFPGRSTYTANAIARNDVELRFITEQDSSPFLHIPVNMRCSKQHVV